MNPLSENKTLSATSLNGAIGACRLNIDAVDELMQLLEGCDWRTYIKMNLPDGKQVHLDGDQITVLRKAYFITLLQQYGPSDEDRDLLLAAAGLLAGYESIDSTETDKSSKIAPRLTKYKEETQYAKSIGALSKNERNKLDKFSNALYAKRQTGTINLWYDVLHYLGVDDFESIPKHITLPAPSYLKRTSAPQRGPVPNQESEQTERTDTPLKMEQETGQAEAASTKVTADQDTATQTASSAAPDNTASSQEVEQAETPNSAEASSGTGSATPDSDASGPVELVVEPKSEPEPETGSRSKPNPEPDPTPAPSEEKVPLAAKLLQRFRNLPIFAKISIFSVGAFLIVLLLIVYFAWYLPQRSNVIQEIMVLNPYLELSPGDYGRLLIAAIGEDPDLDPDLSSLQCHSNDNPLITTAKVNDWAEGNDWTMTWYVLAAQDWTADLPYNGSVSVEGGKAEKVTVPVYVVDEDDKGTRVDPADIPEFWDAADGVISRGEEG